MSRLFLTLEAGGAMLFDGLAAVAWQIEMVRSVNTPPRIRSIIPGVLYTFVFVQNGAGGHSFAWPDSCKNAAPISTSPDATTVQNFIGMADGTLCASIPATYF